MNPLVQSVQIAQIQQQQTQQHNVKQILLWINSQIQKKNISELNSVQQLASGNIFLEIVSIYYPKKVDLTKTFMNPKDDYQILQNFKQLSSAFSKLGWKKFDPEKFRKRKDKELVSMAQYLKKIFSQHLFDNNQSSTVHSLLTSYPCPNKVQATKQNNNLIKIEDRKNSRVASQVQNLQHRQSQTNNKKKNENQKYLPIPRTSNNKEILPPKPQGIQTQRLPKTSNLSTKQITSHKLPPHPNLSSKNMVVSTVTLKSEQQQLNSFENMRITKLQKEKNFLMKKILQIQQLVAREKNQLAKKNFEVKILDEVNEEKFSSKTLLSENQNFLRVKEAIQNILADVHL